MEVKEVLVFLILPTGIFLNSANRHNRYLYWLLWISLGIAFHGLTAVGLIFLHYSPLIIVNRLSLIWVLWLIQVEDGIYILFLLFEVGVSDKSIVFRSVLFIVCSFNFWISCFFLVTVLQMLLLFFIEDIRLQLFIPRFLLITHACNLLQTRSLGFQTDFIVFQRLTAFYQGLCTVFFFQHLKGKLFEFLSMVLGRRRGDWHRCGACCYDQWWLRSW